MLFSMVKQRSCNGIGYSPCLHCRTIHQAEEFKFSETAGLKLVWILQKRPSFSIKGSLAIAADLNQIKVRMKIT